MNFLLETFIYMVSNHNIMVSDNNSREKILHHLLENKDRMPSIRTIAQECHINYKSAYNAVQALEKERLIKIETSGNGRFCSLTNHFSPLLFKVEYERREQLLQKKALRILIRNLENIPDDHIVLLFGSHVKGTARKTSDIDLLIITSNEKNIHTELELLPLDIHPTYISREEFLKMGNNKEFSVVTEVLEKNVILSGIEEFYRLMKHVRT